MLYAQRFFLWFFVIFCCFFPLSSRTFCGSGFTQRTNFPYQMSGNRTSSFLCGKLIAQDKGEKETIWERELEREREREGQTGRERDTHTDRNRVIEREGDRESERRRRKIETDREIEKKRGGQRDHKLLDGPLPLPPHSIQLDGGSGSSPLNASCIMN